MFVCPRSVTESSLGDGNPRSVTESSLGDGKSEVSNRVLFGGWDFFFSTTTYGGAYVVVVMSVCFLFNYSISGWALNLHYNQVKTLGTGLPERCNSFIRSVPRGIIFISVLSHVLSH